MKKILIGAVVIIAGVFGYFVLNKDKIIKDFAIKNLNKTYHLKMIENNPVVKEATITLKSYTDTEANSDLLLSVGSDKFLFPLIHKITIGSAENNGETFGAGKIVTTIDYAKAQLNGVISNKKDIPKFLTNDFITIDSYIGLDGSLRVIANMKSIKDSNGYFEGANFVFNGSLKNKTIAGSDISLDIKKFSSTGYEKINFSGIQSKLTIDNELNVTGAIEPISFVTEYDNQKTVIKTEKATITGKLEPIIALDNRLGGRLKLSFAGLEINDPYKGIVKFDKLAISSKFISSEKGKSVDLGYNVNLLPNRDALKASGATVTISIIDFNLNLDNIPNEVIKIYFKEIENAFVNNSKPKKDTLEKVVSAIYASNFKINSDVYVKSDDGNMKANLNITPSKTKLTTDEIIAIAIYKNNPKILTLFNANIDAQVDETFAKKSGLSMMIQIFADAYVKLENGKYTVKGSLKDGKVTLNGNEIPLPEM